MVLEFLKYAYFNITKGDDMNDILSKCANKAYMDLCRTIRFKTDDGNIKAEYKTKIYDMLVNNYDVLINAVKSTDDKQTVFDKEHKRICEEICSKYSEISEFTYGQAQKWLNMMLKYVLLIEEDSILKSYLHIPVDSYIMQAVGSDNPKLKYCLKLECVPQKNGTVGKYSESGSKPWSKWNYEEYIAFQNCIRAAISESNYSSPIEWENQAWIEVAEYRK
jgi:hypothetical protein